MRYVPTFERKAMQQGELQNARKFIAEALEVRFGVVSEHILSVLKQIEDEDDLQQLHRFAITAESFTTFEQRLREIAPIEPA